MLFSVLVVLLVVLAGGAWLKNRIKNRNMPPRILGALPIIGNAMQLNASGKSLHDTMRELTDGKGGICSMMLGPQYTVIVSNPDLIREVLIDKKHEYNERDCSGRMMNLVFGHSMSMMNGPDHKFLRKLFMTKMFSQTNVNKLDLLMEKEMQRQMGELYHFSERVVNGQVVKGPEEGVTLRNYLRILALNVVWEPSISEYFEIGSDDAHRILAMTEIIFDCAGKAVVMDKVPLIHYLDKSWGASLKYLEEERKELFDTRVKARRLTFDPEAEPRDFCDVLFQAGCSDDLVVGQLIVMITAGLDTTSATIEWALLVLLSKPEVMKKVREEIDTHHHGSALLTTEDIEDMVYLQSFVKELLRLHSPIPLGAPHKARVDTTLGGYEIPADTVLLTTLPSLGHESSIEDSEEFKPERWLNNPVIDVTGKNDIAPFGAGPRLCAGYRLARMEVTQSIANILYFFELKSVDPPSLAEDFTGTVVPKNPLTVHLKARVKEGLDHSIFEAKPTSYKRQPFHFSRQNSFIQDAYRRTSRSSISSISE